MKTVFALFKELFYYIRMLIQSPARWMLLMYVLWVYRVSCMPAVAGGFAQILQIGTLVGMLYFAYTWNTKCVSMGLFRTGGAVLTFVFYLLLGVLSTVWSYKPDFTLFMSIEKLAFLAIFFSLLTIPQTFLATEKFFVFLMLGTLTFNWFAPRLAGYQNLLMAHDLQEGSCAAMCLSYCFGELLSRKVVTERRLAMLRWVAILSIFFMFTSTSGGANASAAFGVAIAFVVSGKMAWAFAFALGGSLLLLNDTLFDRIFDALMQGKSDRDVQTATGRTAIWDALMPLANEKPMLGWGYAAIERLMTDSGIMRLTDTHSNFYGSYGGMGIIGLILLILHHVTSAIVSIRRLMKPGFAGILCALACATMNGYSYGFLAGKTAIITVFYAAFVMLTFVYFYTPVEQE